MRFFFAILKRRRDLTIDRFCWQSSESDFSDTEESNKLGPRFGPKISAMDTVDGVNKRQATRVFKKSSLNGKITVYLGKRDFVDHITHVDPIGKYRSADRSFLQVFRARQRQRTRRTSSFIRVCASND